MENNNQSSESAVRSRLRFRLTMLLLVFAVVGGLMYVAYLRHSNSNTPSGTNHQNASSDSGRENADSRDAVHSQNRDKAVSEDDAGSRAAILLAQRKRLDETIWKDEVLSQEYEQVFVDLWDQLRAAKDKLKVAESFPLQRLILGKPREPQSRDLGITVTQYSGQEKTLDQAGWRSLLSQFRQAGFEIVQTEWHHANFYPDDANAVRSTVNMTAHVLNRRTDKRYIINGALQVEWEPRTSADKLPRVRTIDASALTIMERPGKPAFRMAYGIQPAAKAVGKPDPMLLPVHLYDLDGDGLSEVIVPSLNDMYLNRGHFEFKKMALFKHPLESAVLVGVFADFTGDGHADFLCAEKGPLIFYEADADGRFSLPPRRASDGDIKFVNASVFTAGDVDADGDLDVWVGQYKGAYTGGQMPTPYYDANDGFADYLFQNDGNGHFTDVTRSAGLSAKRFRRTYGGSLIDLDEDRDLDLVVCCDFAGLDIYLNDGRGTFTDVTKTRLDIRHAFGMSLSFADYNLDGKTDIFMTGMGSTTARRLEQLKLGRDEFPLHQQMRMPMGYGNRMYLATDQEAEDAGGVERHFLQAPFNDQVARTGWSWGSTSFDFDNDGDCDIYVANGFMSQGSAKDYCTHFWRKDIYMGNSTHDPAIVAMHALETAGMGTMSWNGYEHNCLLMNEAGGGFINVSFLMDVAFEYDSRSVVSDDLDGDGRTDLIVYKFSTDAGFPFEIHLLENQLVTDRHWIGVRLENENNKHSPMGATVILRSSEGEQIAKIVSGDSYYCQHAPSVHFGLGSQTKVDSVEVTWIDGTRRKIDNPQIDQYHRIKGLASDLNSQ